MVPTFMRIVRARRGSRSDQRPSREHQALPAVVGAERVAAGGAEVEAGVEVRAREGAVGAGAADLGEERVGVERAGAGDEQDVLAEDVERPRSARLAVEVVRAHRVERGAALQHLEAVRRHEHGARGGVVAVVGAADALDEALDVLRRADLHDQVDVAPVDAEIEAAGGDDGAQATPPPSPPRPGRGPRGESEPWWRPMGRSSPFSAQSAWKKSSAWARVLMKTRVVVAPRISSMTAGAA